MKDKKHKTIPPSITAVREVDYSHGYHVVTFLDKKTGSTWEGTYTDDEYKVVILKYKLYANGADWDDLEKLCDLSRSAGYEGGYEAAMDLVD